MFDFKKMGFVLDLSNDWKNVSSSKNHVPFCLETLENGDIILNILFYGYDSLEVIDAYLLMQRDRTEDISKKILHSEINVKNIDGFNQKFYKVIIYDDTKKICNFKYFTTFSNQKCVYGCLEFYCNIEDLDYVQEIIDKHFHYVEVSE